MRILVNKSGRKVTLTKRERDSLEAAKALLVELASSGDEGTRDDADVAADKIGEVLRALDGVEVAA